MNETKVEGNKTTSEVVKKRGQAIGHTSEHEGSGKHAIHNSDSNLPEFGFDAGRTIELRRFEFCRVRLGIHLRLPPESGIQKVEAMDAMEKFITEILKKEEASVSNNVYELDIDDASKELLSKCCCRCLKVSYGLTLKSGIKEFESHTVDVYQDLPVSDGSDLMEVYDSLADEMAAELDKQHARIKGIDKNTGL